MVTFDQWLWRHWQHCQEKKVVVKEGLEVCDIPVEELQKRWRVQVAMQTKPAPNCCEEEVVHVMWERCVLQEWMQEEWMQVGHVKEQFDEDEDMSFVLDQHATMLAEMCAMWQEKLHGIPCLWPMSQDWEPPPEKLVAVASYHHDLVTNGSSAVVVDDDEYEDSSDGDNGDELSWTDFEYELCDLDPLSSPVHP
ncbi:hypothetical protein K503DRAFT_788013 [Rhizopogon vinicolor AM-OR11-026]|uniref:Uncharacterized protein n=1 Tax=Rhizopogon vinicolor AM-OR11-026 TaxID=1314800 RepID=A0A1B7MEY4_9AGAM|nr:hypothetical protein K503DRAFT_788013 [Rhizopogon vinicolor AM-OR11-026]